MALPQSCNGCNTIDYDGELNEAGVCGACAADPIASVGDSQGACVDCGGTGHDEEDHDRRTDDGSIVFRRA